jgi:predicted chitinase
LGLRLDLQDLLRHVTTRVNGGKHGVQRGTTDLCLIQSHIQKIVDASMLIQR